MYFYGSLVMRSSLHVYVVLVLRLLRENNLEGLALFRRRWECLPILPRLLVFLDQQIYLLVHVVAIVHFLVIALSAVYL